MGGVFHRADQIELMPHRLEHVRRQAFGIARRHAFPDIVFQRCLGILARDDRLLRILIGQLFKRKFAPVDDLHGSRQSFRIARKQALHLFWRLQVPVGMALALETDIVDGLAGPNAGNDILQLPAARFMKQHIVGDDRLHLESRRQIGNLIETQLVVWPPAQAQRHIGTVGKNLRHFPQSHGTDIVCEVGHEDADHPFGIGDDVIPVQDAFVLAATRFAERDQPGEPRIGGPVDRIDEDGHAVGEIEAATDDQPQSCATRRFERADDAGQRISIDDADGIDAKRCGGLEQVLRRGRPAQEGKMRRHLQLGISHAKIPWQNQRWLPVSGSTPSPDRNTHRRSPVSSSITK